LLLISSSAFLIVFGFWLFFIFYVAPSQPVHLMDYMLTMASIFRWGACNEAIWTSPNDSVPCRAVPSSLIRCQILLTFNIYTHSLCQDAGSFGNLCCWHCCVKN